MKRREGRLNIQDCRAITSAAYFHLAAGTRPREAWEGSEALPFEYVEKEKEGMILKSFWSWRRVGVPPGWREARQRGGGGDIIQHQALSENERSGLRRNIMPERERCTIM